MWSPVSCAKHTTSPNVHLTSISKRGRNIERSHSSSAPPSFVADYAARLRESGIEKDLCNGKALHQSILKHGYEGDPYLGNLLIQMYARCMDLESAHSCFDQMGSHRNVFAYNFVIGAYEGIEHMEMTISLFQQMQIENVMPDKVTFVYALSAYANLVGKNTLLQGKFLHVWVISMGLDTNFFVSTGLVNLYGKHNELNLAQTTFERMHERDLVSWNALISAYAQQGKDKDAFNTFKQLHIEGLLPDKVTFVNVLCAFGTPDALIYGKWIHASLHQDGVLEGNVVVATALANMYGKCRCLDSSRSIFDHMVVRNVVSWNAMIAVYTQLELGKEALELYYQMNKQGLVGNKVTFVSVLDACANEGLLGEGQTIHALMSKCAYDVDVIVGTAIVNMYNNCNSLQDGKRVFDLLPERNIISWNVMMSGFVRHGYGNDAVLLFDRMQSEDVMPDELTVLAALCGCSLEVSLARGIGLHNHVIQNGFELDTIVGNALLNMYGKCGCLDEAQVVFDKMLDKSMVTWNSMVAVHAQHGNGKEVLELLFTMQSQDVTPNGTTLSNVLCICSHIGLVVDCLVFWSSIVRDCQIPLTLDHFDTVIDMFGRAGQVDEAEALLCMMPIQPSALSWTTLLTACRNSTDLMRGTYAAKSSVELDTSDEVTYITLSNIYATCGVTGQTLMLTNSLMHQL